MDYFVELASVPDLCEAIKLDYLDLEPHAGTRLSKDAEDLLFYDFLREEHPSAWTVEVVHAFYKSPDFAARVWHNLRYCDTFRRTAAKDLLSDMSSTWLRAPMTWLGKSKLQEVDADAQLYVQHFSTQPDDAVRQYAADLQSKPAVVDEFCHRTGKHPEPPKFLGDLMQARNTPANQYDEQTQHLLAHPNQVRQRARETGIAIPFSMVLEQELEQIQATRTTVHRSGHSTYREKNPATSAPAPESGAPIRRALNADLLGLAFPGGGIRSATFNLGVLQALAKIGLLRQCDYLSTVSSGGYIGSWLAAWIRRESRAGRGDGVTMVDMQRRLSPIRSPNPMDEKVRPIRFLREYSNYLTPSTGFFSADTWTMIGIYVRNTLLNQVIIVSLAAAALMVPRLWFALMQWLDQETVTSVGANEGRALSVIVALLLWGCGIVFLILNLRQLRPPSSSTAAVTDTSAPPIDQGYRRWYARPSVIQAGVVLWLAAAALTAHCFGYTTITSGMQATDARWLVPSLVAGGIVSATLWVVLLLGKTSQSWLPVMDVVAGSPTWSTQAERRAKLRAFFAISGSALVAGVVAAGLTWVLLRALSARAANPEELRWHVVAFGTAGLLSVTSLAIVAMLGMLGERFPDEHREWWSKFRTFIHVWAIGWLSAFLAAVYVPWGFHWLLKHYSLSAGLSALAAWIASTLFGVQKGRTAKDDQKHQREAAGAGVSMSARALHAAALVAPFVFIIGLVCAISIAIDGVFWANQPGLP